MIDIFKKGVYFKPDGGGATGSGSAGGSATAGSNVSAETQAAGGQQAAAASGQNQAGAKAYTQDELNALFAERATRAEQSTLKKVLESLGVEKVEDAQKIIHDTKKAQEAQLSEIEKVKKAHGEVETNYAKLQAEHTSLLNRTAFNAKASALGLVFASPEAQMDAFEKTDLAKVDVSDAKALEAAIQVTVKARPYLLKSAGTGGGAPDIDGAHKGTNAGGKLDEAREKELRAKYRI